MTTDNPQGTGSGTTFASAVLERLKSDTHLVLLSVFSSVASLAIGSFAIYRLIQGEFVVALFDGLLIAVISSVPEVFTDRVERFTFLAVALQVVVFCLVFALQTSRQYRQLDVMANRDPLTGVANRRALDKFQSAIHERLRGPDGPVTVARKPGKPHGTSGCARSFRSDRMGLACSTPRPGFSGQ